MVFPPKDKLIWPRVNLLFSVASYSFCTNGSSRPLSLHISVILQLREYMSKDQKSVDVIYRMARDKALGY
jgi:hypothetical protein